MVGLRDQRTMQGRHVLASPEGVRQFWNQWAARKGFAARRTPNGTLAKNLVDDGREAVGYVNDGRWVADCSYCTGGMAAWPDHEFACCLDCGHLHRVTFPDPRTRAEALPLLMARPEPNRNWRGETLAQLAAENARNGFPERA